MPHRLFTYIYMGNNALEAPKFSGLATSVTKARNLVPFQQALFLHHVLSRGVGTLLFQISRNPCCLCTVVPFKPMWLSRMARSKFRYPPSSRAALGDSTLCEMPSQHPALAPRTWCRDDGAPADSAPGVGLRLGAGGSQVSELAG